jgi:DtxR family Mn-dependent transcriptional regulator
LRRVSLITLTIENYVKAIYQICSETGQATVSNGEISRRLSVAPGTVTSMLRTLQESGLVNYQSHRGASLTESGKKLALHVIRKHRLIELFLSKTLGMTWDEVHEEAEHLEHAVSEHLADRIDSFLGFPDRDPHGDPIPSQDGTMVLDSPRPLTEVARNEQFTLSRVSDQSSEFLRYLSQVGLHVGAKGHVEEYRPEASAMVIQTEDGRQVVLGKEAAQKLFVRSTE